MYVYNEFEVDTLVINNRIYVFNEIADPYIEISIRLIKEYINNENFYGTTGIIKFNKYNYSMRDPFFSKKSLDEILKNPSFILQKFLGGTNYLLTGLKNKLKYDVDNSSINDVNKLVIKYYEKNNKKYIATYGDSPNTIYCCATCKGTGDTIVTTGDDCNQCSNNLRARCPDRDITDFNCASNINDACSDLSNNK